jgi:pectate lyase
MVFWVVMPCSVVMGYHFNPEDGDNTVLRNVCIQTVYYTAQQARKPEIIHRRKNFKCGEHFQSLFCSVVVGCQFNPEDGGNTMLRNLCIQTAYYAAQKPRKPGIIHRRKNFKCRKNFQSFSPSYIMKIICT